MVTYSLEMRERVLRMLAEADPDHATEWSAIRHVAQLLGMSPETLRLRDTIEPDDESHLAEVVRTLTATAGT